MSNATYTLGGTSSWAGTTIGKIGVPWPDDDDVWIPTPVPDEQCFEAIKAGMDKLPPGAKMVLNSAEFYGFKPPEANLELIARFFEKYPEYSEKAFLVVKGGAKPNFGINLTLEGLRSSARNINAKLRGTHHIDVFEPARLEQSTYPLEDVMKSLKALCEEGLCKGVGLSECSAETIMRASKIWPVVTAQIEVSLWSWEEETKKVIATCEETNTIVLAYSPLGRGFLAGSVTKPEDMEDGDIRKHLTRFTDETMKSNAAIADALKNMAEKKGYTTAQLCIAWVSSRGKHVIPIPGSSKSQRTLENLAAGDIELSAEDLKEIEEVLEKHPVNGTRYVDGVPTEKLCLWG